MASRRVEAELDALDSLTAPSARIPWEDPGGPDAELIAMAYPRDAGDVGSTRRSRLQRVRKALDYLVSIGYADCQPGQRLRPGPDWAGWPKATG